MRILLVNTPTEIQLVRPKGLFTPLGLGYIAAILLQEGHEVRIKDFTVEPEPPEGFHKILAAFDPDMVGFSAVTASINLARKYAAVAKQAGKITVIGGPHVSALPGEAVDPNVDIIVRGEGEYTMREIAAAPNRLADIAGISYLRNGALVHNPSRPLIQNLDELPLPARELFPSPEKYEGQPYLGNRIPVGNISTSRGCPYNCMFCYKSLFGNRFRSRSAESIIAEWELLVRKYGVKEITIHEDAFTTDSARVHQLCDLLIKNKLNIPWNCSTGIRINNASYDLLRHMRQAGCYRVGFGIESGDQAVLELMGKNITLAQAEAAIKNAREAKVKSMGFFMLGTPWDSLASMQKTIDFAVQVRPDHAQFLIAIPYPGTSMADIVKREGQILTTNWSDFVVYEGEVFFEMPGKFTKEQVLAMQRRAYRSFYLNPQNVLAKLTQFDTYRYLLSNLSGLKRFVLSRRTAL